MLSDTSPEAQRVQIELLRRLTPAQRVSMMRSLTDMAVRLSRRALARAHPNWSQRDLDLRFVELIYGKELAHGLGKHLDGMRHAES